MKRVTKAVIAVAGYGTRFLPATKNQPKEMLPIIDKPIIHYLVEECVNAGITDIILVTRYGQGIMEDYFDSHLELERYLEENGKFDILEEVRSIPQKANIVYVRQNKTLPYGNGTPLVCASSLLAKDESFAYMFGDDLVLAKKPAIKQLMETYEHTNCDGVIAVQEIPNEESYRYGIVKYKEGSKEFDAIVEKPDPKDAPSNDAEFGRFILNYSVVDELKKLHTGLGNELWLVDAITSVAAQGGRFVTHTVDGEWLTTGDPLRYLKTTVKFALDREDIGEDFRKYLKSVL